jgi:hypothetical protein
LVSALIRSTIDGGASASAGPAAVCMADRPWSLVFCWASSGCRSTCGAARYAMLNCRSFSTDASPVTAGMDTDRTLLATCWS